MLELIQLSYMSIMIGDGRNNFIIEWNEDREEDALASFQGPQVPSVN
jgi:segregation and condensation protein A